MRGNDRLRQPDETPASTRDAPGSGEFGQSAAAPAESDHDDLRVCEGGMETERGASAEKIQHAHLFVSARKTHLAGTRPAAGARSQRRAHRGVFVAPETKRPCDLDAA